jgi:hypothetical protein
MLVFSKTFMLTDLFSGFVRKAEQTRLNCANRLSASVNPSSTGLQRFATFRFTNRAIAIISKQCDPLIAFCDFANLNILPSTVSPVSASQAIEQNWARCDSGETTPYASGRCASFHTATPRSISQIGRMTC